jgi:hypothetical protein
MNSKFKIALLVGVLMLVCGVAVSGAGFMMGGMKDIVLDANGPRILEEETSIETLDEVFENVSSINLDLDAVERVTIKEGTEWRVKGQNLLLSGKLTAEYAEDGTLTVAQRNENSKRWWHGIIGFHSLFRNISEYPLTYLEITVPQGASLTGLSLNLDFGDLEMDRLSAGAISMVLNAGEVTASNLTCDTFSAELQYGTTRVENVETKEFFLKNASGNSEIRNLIAPNKLNIDSDYGKIDIEEVTAGESNFYLASGNFMGRDLTFIGGMTLESNYGNIDFRGVLRGDNRIESDAGNINLTLDGTEDDYSIDAEVKAGRISVGNKDFTNRGLHLESTESSGDITIRSNYGNVKIGFQN